MNNKKYVILGYFLITSLVLASDVTNNMHRPVTSDSEDSVVTIPGQLGSGQLAPEQLSRHIPVGPSDSVIGQRSPFLSSQSSNSRASIRDLFENFQDDQETLTSQNLLNLSVDNTESHKFERIIQDNQSFNAVAVPSDQQYQMSLSSNLVNSYIGNRAQSSEILQDDDQVDSACFISSQRLFNSQEEVENRWSSPRSIDVDQQAANEPSVSDSVVAVNQQEQPTVERVPTVTFVDLDEDKQSAPGCFDSIKACCAFICGFCK